LYSDWAISRGCGVTTSSLGTAAKEPSEANAGADTHRDMTRANAHVR
jgi:hypothetical protein